jgi:mono/diheme cytochrome c family protein
LGSLGLVALVLACTPRGEPSRAQARRLSLRESPRVASARALGEVLFQGRGGCTACHRLGRDGDAEVGPNLRAGPGFDEPLGRRAHVTRPVFMHVVEALVDPDAYVVDGYPSGKMPRVEEPPIALVDGDIVALAVYVASLDADHPLSESLLDEGPAEVARVRLARAERVANRRVRELVARARLDGIDPGLGATVLVQAGCSTCHGPPATCALRPPADRSGAPSVLAWLAETLPRHPYGTGLSRPSEVAALAAWLASL